MFEIITLSPGKKIVKNLGISAVGYNKASKIFCELDLSWIMAATGICDLRADGKQVLPRSSVANPEVARARHLLHANACELSVDT